MHPQALAADVAQLPIGVIVPGEGGPPRADLDPRRLRTVAVHVRRVGLRDPIVVAPSSGSDRYEIVEGELRWRAAQLAGLTDVPCVVDSARGEERRRLLSEAAEALRRDELGVLDEAAILVKVMQVLRADAAEAGALLGMSYQQARRMIQIHGAPPPIQAALAARRIDWRAALELVRIYNRMRRLSAYGEARAHHEVETLVARVVDERWSIRHLEEYARALASGTGDVARRASPGFRLVRGRLVVNTASVAQGELSPEERAQLITILEDLLRALKAI
jgi:ParB family chromosome partitioning protein